MAVRVVRNWLAGQGHLEDLLAIGLRGAFLSALIN